jgi:TonB family protein
VGDAALQDLRKMIDVTTSVDVEVDVNDEGSVTMTTVRRGSGLETVDHIITSEVGKLRFLPAKPAETYAPGTIRISCRIEAR